MTKPAQHKGPVGLGGPPPGAIVIKRPIDRADPPIESGNYRIGTPAIEAVCARNGSGGVVMFFDEAQRYGENEYEWLRDAHATWTASTSGCSRS